MTSRSDALGLRLSRRGNLLVAAVALAASVAGIRNDFVYDDVPLIRDNARVHGLSQWRDIVTLPYWPPPFVENLHRPATMATVAAEYTVGGGSPLVFRVVSLALYALAAVLVWRLASRLLAPGAALAAGVLFAAHPVHVEAVAQGVNQAELVVGMVACAMLLLYLRWREKGVLSAGQWGALGALYAVAALSKETGFVLPLLLGVAELLLVPSARRDGAMPGLARGYASVIGIGVALLWWRTAVLSGRLAGTTPASAFAGLDHLGQALLMLQVVPHWLRLLAWPQHLQADYPREDFTLPPTYGAAAAGTLLVIAAAWLVILVRRRAPIVSFGLAACAVTLLPVSNIVPTGILLAERTLFLPSVGFVLAVAAAAEWLVASAGGRAPAARRVLTAACVVLAALGVGRSVSRQLVWNSAHIQVVPRTSDR